MLFRSLGPVRGSGKWDIITGDRGEWLSSYLRVVNRQFRNDPAAMRIIAGESDEAVLTWLAKDPQGIAYWKGLRDHYDSPDDWLVTLRSDVDNLLPTEQARTLAGTRRLSEQDVAEMWPAAATRPGVPGELLKTPAERNIVMDGYLKTQEQFFKYAADIPETMMGRHQIGRASCRVRVYI